ncbi:MAG: hypothetical protein Kow0029_00100 [Candidatus Rifleibacteriota bacterium]
MFIPSIKYRIGGQLGLLRRFLDSNNRLKALLLLMMFMGIVLFMPNRMDQNFHPRALILVIFPAFVILFCWLYIRLVANGFSVISRHLPDTCLEQEMIEVELLVRYRCPIPFSNATLREDFPAADILESPEIILNYKDFRKTGQAKVSYKNLLNRGYGHFTIGPTEIKIRDPIGFFERKLNFPLKSKIDIWFNPPAPDDLDLVKENALTPMGDSRSTLNGHGMDFYGIKEYVPGDDIRAMSWLKTAQTGKPIIKQFERDTKPDVFVAIHTDKSQLRGFGFGNTMKRLMRISAAIISETQKKGLPTAIGLCIEEDAHYLKLNSAVPVYGFLTDLLADLKPAEEGGLQQLINLAMRKAGPGSIVIFLSQTVHLDMDILLGALINLKARGAKVELWAIDDSNLVRFSEDQRNILSKDEFKQRMEEMDLKLVLIPSRRDNIGAL